MKQYLIGASLAAILSLLALSCDKNGGNPEETLPAIRIENGEIGFPPAGGVDTVRIYNAAKVSATADLPWCTVREVEKGFLEVTAGPYTGVESRYCMINIQADEKACYVVIQQSGVYIQGFDDSNLNLKNGAARVERTFKTNGSFTASSGEDWIHVETGDGVLRIAVDENTGKDYREGGVHWAIGDLDGVISVTQFDAADAGLLGSYIWSGTNQKNNRQWTINAELTAGGGDAYNLAITSNTYKLNIPVTMDKQTLLIPLGQPVGTYTTSAGAVYKVIPLIAPGTAAILYANAITTGTYSLVFTRQEDGKWKATADYSPYAGQNFQFANWANAADYLTDKSATNGIYLQGITLTQE